MSSRAVSFAGGTEVGGSVPGEGALDGMQPGVQVDATVESLVLGVETLGHGLLGYGLGA
jgi:hypothetical protein